MAERRYVKFKVNMYDDTKFKIIDRMEKRDLINYVWTRLVVLAGKVNLEGELFLSRNIPYTLDTLAIEFNREVSEIELAIKTFIDLEMVEVTQNKVYKVKNFTKHQDAKRSKKVQNQDEAEVVENNKEKEKSIGNQIVKDLNKNIDENTDTLLESSDTKSKPIGTGINEEEIPYKSGKDNIYDHGDNNNKVIDINTTNTNSATIQKLNLNMEKCENKDDSSSDILTPLNNKKVKNKSTPKKKEIINEINITDENEDIISFSGGAPAIGKDEKVVCDFSF